MKKENREQNSIKRNDTHGFLKILAALFAIIAIYTIIDNPMGVIEGILDSLK